MEERSSLGFLRSRLAVVTFAAVLTITSAGALYVYLGSSQPQPVTQQPASSSVKPSSSSSPSAVPNVTEVGSQTVTNASAGEVLSVIATTPTSGGTGASPRTPIQLSFNLSVDPVAAQTYFSVLPAIEGTFSQGRTPQDIVFTPSGSFGRGSSVTVVLRKGYMSRDGYALEDDYTFSFKTALSRAQVVFQVGDQIARLHNVPSGRSVTVTLQFGDHVPADTVLETFRATSGELLTGFVHSANGSYRDRPIPTATMQSVARVRAVNGRSYTFTQPAGIYLVLAANSQAQYGAMWLDFSRFGVILRQDDQKIVGAGLDLTTGSTDPTFDITFYSLRNEVEPVLSGSFTGRGEFAARYPAPFEMAVATSAGEDVVIPLGIPQTNADIKVVRDLSEQPHIFLTTDRAGYQRQDVVKFSGVVRTSNDQTYTLPTGQTIVVWSGYGANKPVSKRVTVSPDGTFHGSFAMPASAFNTDGTDSQLTLYAGSSAQEADDTSPYFTVVEALGEHTPKARITVDFDKATYLSGDKIIASLSAVDSSGMPLSAKRLRLTLYSTGRTWQPSEFDNFAAPSTWGLPMQEASISLDSEGHVTYRFGANVGRKDSDQEVTLVARYGSGETAAIGARTAVVYQAAEEVFLLPSRTMYQPGETVIAPFVVENTAGERAGGVPVTYEFGRTEYKGSKATTTVVASGALTTSSNGRGVVRAELSVPAGELVLRIKGKDAAGNQFVDARPLTITTDPDSFASAGAADSLVQLSVTTDKISYRTGETARITVTSPAAMSTFISLERGRIHRSEWVSLQRGDNLLKYKISSDLAPGFTLTFSYFRDGSFFTEGLPISINNADRLLKVTLASDQTTYASGQSAHVTVTVTDSTGAPVTAALLVDGYDARMSANKLVDRASIAGAFFNADLRATNSSSSLVGIGNWGGRCGISAGANDAAATNPGRLAVWLPHLMTDDQGRASIDVPVEQGSVRLVVYAATSTLFGQAYLDLSVP